MRKLMAFLAAGLFALGTAGVASAAILDYSGTMTTYLGDFPPGAVAGGGVATINDSSGGVPAHLSTLRLAESRGQIGGGFTRFVTDPETIANGVAALVYDIGAGTGTISAISGGAASTAATPQRLPTRGIVKVCILSTACTQFLPMVLNQPTTVNGVPGTGSKAVGVGGLITAGGYGGIRISLQAVPWTIKTATVLDQITPEAGPPRVNTTLTAKGWAHAPASTTTSTAQPSGMLQLVTPLQVTTNLPLGSNDKLGGFVIMVYEFIPEPGLVLLLGSGVAGLAALGRSRMRK